MDKFPVRYELDDYGFRVEVFMELESVEERQYRQRKEAERKAACCRHDVGISGQKIDAERALAWALIDWHAVEPLEAEEKCVDENPAHLSIPF